MPDNAGDPIRGRPLRWLPYTVAVALTCGPVVMAVQPAGAAENKSGIVPNVISLPSGPGSIEGLGDSFEPDLNSGAAGYRLVIETPPGRGGFAPELALHYSSGNPNGMLGLGWRTSIPFVQHQTEKGLPNYTLWPDGDGVDNDKDGEVDDYDEFDTVIYSNKEELVPVAEDHWRFENESDFLRFRKVDDGWLATRRDGVALEFGRTDSSRVESAGRVFRWHLDRMVDPNGNVISLEYRKLDDSAQVYPERIVYNQTGSAAMEVRFEHELRPDVIVDFRSRFELKTAYRCTEIAVIADGEPVRSYKLGYANPTAWQPLSLLASITEIGRDGVSPLPPTRFGYTGPDPADPVARLLDRAPFIDLNDRNIDLLDVNADGLPDVIDTGRRPHFYYLNEGADETGQVRWANAVPMNNNDGWDLGARDVRLADMNGDGHTDLLNLHAKTVHYYSVDYSTSTAAAAWQREAPIQGAGFWFSDPAVKLQDVDHDKRIDVIQIAGEYLFAWINHGNGAWSGRYTWPLSSPQLQLDRSTTLLADMNGDRLLDLVHVAPGALHYYPATGFGELGEGIAMSNAPRRIIDPNRLLITDMNGDGRGDVAYLDGSLHVWFNLGLDASDHTRGVLTSPFSTRSPLLSAFKFKAWRQADVNGNGSTDILWNTTLNGRVQLAFLDLSPGAPPNLLNSVDNGIGGRTRMHYSSSVAEMVRDAGAGRPWSQTLPFPVPVVSSMEVDDGHENTYRTEFAYRDGYYDAVEKEFRGFAEVVKTEIGDETIPSLTTSYSFDTGRNVEALKGKLLALETRGPDDELFFRERHDWSTTTLAQGAPGEARGVAWAFRSAKRLDVHEGAQSPVSARWDYEYDDFGNVTRVYEHGRLDPGWEDERVTETTWTASYPDGLDAWILDRVVERSTLDPDGNRIAAERRYYDGNAALGAVGTGNPTRTEGWVGGSRWLDRERKDYDAFGNVTAVYDGEYRRPSDGHFREVSYDPEFTTYPVREVVHTGNAAAPRLEMRATYDAGFGKVTSHTDFSGHLTTYAYDTFGRLIATVKPGDSTDEPTEAYDYVLDFDAGDGVRVNWVETRRRERAGGGTVDSRLFYDGLGRQIMTREEDEAPGRVVVTGTVQFNARRSPWRRYLPYFEVGTLDFKAPPFAAASVEHRYDALGREVRLTQPDGSFSTIEYEPFAKLVRDEEQTNLESMYAGAARRLVVDGLQDDKGNGRLREVHEIVKLTDAGRRSSEPADWTTRYDYDLLDNVVQITDAQGNRKRAVFDGLGRKVLDDDPNRGVTSYRYDAASNLRETIDAKRQRIAYDYDGANRLVAERYHDGGTPPSAPSSIPSAANRKPDVRYVYDRSAVEAELADGRRASPRNTLGRLASIYDLSGESHTSYDPRGRVEWRVKGILHPKTGVVESYASAMGYDSMDRVTSLVYPDNDRIAYAYNPRGLLEGVERGGPRGPDGSRDPVSSDRARASVLANLAYIPSGQFARADHGNGVSTIYDYDDRLRLRRLTSAKPGESPLLDYAYRLDGVSNIVAIDDLRPRIGALADTPERSNDQSFEHDDLYRLTRVRYGFEADGGEAGISYRYDRIGNLLEQSSNIPHREHGRNVADLGRLDYLGGRSQRAGRAPGDPPGPHAATGTSNQRLAYDDNGNVVRLDDLELVWDFKDRLVAVKSDRITAEYVYDHADRRVTKHVRRVDGGKPAESVVQYVDRHYEVRDGAPVKYVYAGKRRVARLTGAAALADGQGPPLPDPAFAIRYYHQDHLGSTNVMTDAAGNLLEEIAYYPYGSTRETYRRTSFEAEPYRFSQKETDKETGLQYFEARYLDGALARFLSVDPILQRPLQHPFEEPQRLNAYSYSLNRPLIYQDPTGEWAALLVGGANLLVGGASNVALGYALSKATGLEYGWTDASIDFVSGTMFLGRFSKLHKRIVRVPGGKRLGRSLEAMGHVRKQKPAGVVEFKQKGHPILGKIKPNPAKSKGTGMHSKHPRITLRIDTGHASATGHASMYLDPFTGKSALFAREGLHSTGLGLQIAHTPLEPLAHAPFISRWTPVRMGIGVSAQGISWDAKKTLRQFDMYHPGNSGE